MFNLIRRDAILQKRQLLGFILFIVMNSHPTFFSTFEAKSYPK